MTSLLPKKQKNKAIKNQYNKQIKQIKTKK